MISSTDKVAWYDIRAKGTLRDFLIILHPPYTFWHLSYVVIGAALSPVISWSTLAWTLLAFFLGMGIGGHCLDELNGRPLKTQMPTWLLGGVAVLSVTGAVVIGVIIGLKETIWVLPCIIFGGFIVFAYNMEWPPSSWKGVFIANLLPTGFFHWDIWFGFAWGAFPAITAYIAQAHTVSPALVLVAFACLLYSMTQRVLSLHARFWRRKVETVQAFYYLVGETPFLPSPYPGQQSHELTKKDIIQPSEVALKYMTWTVVSAAIGLIVIQL